MARVLTLAICLFVFSTSPLAQSQPSRSDDPSQLNTFLTQLQRATLADDRAAVVSLIRFPVTVAVGGIRVPFTTAESFLARYDDILNPPLLEAIERATVHPRPDGRMITVTPETFVIGANEVVVAPVNGRLLIVSMTVPEFAEGAPAPAATPTGPSTSAWRTQEPRRIAIRVSPRATQIPGLLARNATDSFILYLPKGLLAGVRLERVPAGAAAIRVVHARTGSPLGPRASADGRFVSGRPADSADYRIEVRWTAGDSEAPLPYMLSLTLR